MTGAWGEVLFSQESENSPHLPAGNANLIIVTPGAAAIKRLLCLPQSENTHYCVCRTTVLQSKKPALQQQLSDGWRLNLHRKRSGVYMEMGI